MIPHSLLLSGMDIPFPEARVNIVQPKVKDILYISEDSFYSGCELLNFSKDVLYQQDKVGLEDKTNFDILMSIMTDKSKESQVVRNNALMVLTLLFPDFIIRLLPASIELEKEENKFYIDNRNFEEFKQILKQMFCLEEHNEKNPEYNPGGSKAAAIAEKLKKARMQKQQTSAEHKEIIIISKYVSILSVGLKLNINEIESEYTLYQLFEQQKRFSLKEQNDIYLKAKLAGAKDLKEIDNWMDDIHP